MTTESPHPLQRRAHVRQPILLPVRLTFLGGTKQGGALAKFGSVYALALDVSCGGMQLVVSGTVARHLLGDFEAGCAVQVGFVHVDLKGGGDRIARARWARAAEDRSECILGVEFDKPAPDSAVAQIVRRGALTPQGRGVALGIVAALALLMLGFASLWIGARASVADKEKLAEVADAERTECREALTACRIRLERAEVQAKEAAAIKRPEPAHEAPVEPVAPRPVEHAADAGAPHERDSR
jgi:hypothetical protein